MKVPIKNVLYMFSYIWDRADYIDFKYLNNEDDFDSVNILSKLFLVNINEIMKKGLYREYNEKSEELKGIKGKIDFSDSMNKISFNNAKAVCIYDELEENNIINQIVKTTAYKLYKSENISYNYKKKMNNILLYFNQVSIIELKRDTFSKIKYNKNNYYMYYMISICKLINEATMLSETKGKYKFIDVLSDDRKMQQVFELFIFKFYEAKLKNCKVSYQKKINWKLFGKNGEIIPEMKLDIFIEREKDDIIIDTKYYSNFLKKNFYSTNNKKTLISGNLYQMYTYMNHIESCKNIKGILLYPYNGEEISEKYDMKAIYNDGIRRAELQIQTIDLSKEWREIERQLLEIIDI